MKVIITLVLLYFCLSAMESPSENRKQDSKTKVQLKADSTSIKLGDSITKNSININGQLNAVSINNNVAVAKNPDAKDTKATNTIKINGDSNSVIINQNNKNAGNVNIQQNGNGNKVNVSQSNSEK